MMKLGKKDILGIQDMTVDEINLILETAESFLEISTREIKKVPTLRGKSDDQFVLRSQHPHANIF